MTSCLRGGGGGGGGTYVFDLDVVKTSSSSWCRSSQSSASSYPSSTLSDLSNSPPLAISIKRARTPRKRPNQIYNEAAALLSATYPAVFSAVKSPRLLLSNTTNPFHPFPEPPDLLPPLPVLNDAAFLIPNPNPPSAAAAVHFHLKRKTFLTASEKDSAVSPASDVSRESNSPECPIEDDFDAESILESEVAQGIDSIIGNLTVDTSTTDSTNYPINSLLRSLVGRRISSNFELGFGLRRAPRKRDEDKQWSSNSVPMSDINPNYEPPSPPAPEKIEVVNPEQGRLKAALGLRLNHEEVVRDWADRGSVFSDRCQS
ncbi:protein CHLOROPLAST IMPORT APPARATUS 2-like [Zingiber officinale]|nr:protein CHLOROPLAST IMPORT APPARATUS 2-like [Zingiber officinale]